MINGPIKHTLSKPVMSVDREVTELTLRPPKGIDMRSCGDQSDPGFTHRQGAETRGGKGNRGAKKTPPLTARRVGGAGTEKRPKLGHALAWHP